MVRARRQLGFERFGIAIKENAKAVNRLLDFGFERRNLRCGGGDLRGCLRDGQSRCDSRLQLLLLELQRVLLGGDIRLRDRQLVLKAAEHDVVLSDFGKKGDQRITPGFDLGFERILGSLDGAARSAETHRFPIRHRIRPHRDCFRRQSRAVGATAPTPVPTDVPPLPVEVPPPETVDDPVPTEPTPKAFLLARLRE